MVLEDLGTKALRKDRCFFVPAKPEQSPGWHLDGLFFIGSATT